MLAAVLTTMFSSRSEGFLSKSEYLSELIKILVRDDMVGSKMAPLLASFGLQDKFKY